MARINACAGRLEEIHVEQAKVGGLTADEFGLAVLQAAATTITRLSPADQHAFVMRKAAAILGICADKLEETEKASFTRH